MLVSFFSDVLYYKVSFAISQKKLTWKTEKTIQPQTVKYISSGNKSAIYRGSSVEDISSEKGNTHKYKQFIKQDT